MGRYSWLSHQLNTCKGKLVLTVAPQQTRRAKTQNRMLTCTTRSLLLSRVDQVLKFTSTYVKPRPIFYFQGRCFYYNLGYNWKMSGAKEKPGALYRIKKQKPSNLVWRPVCSQASFSEESLVNEVAVESEDVSQIQEVHCSTSSDVSDAQHVMEIKAVTEATDTTLSSPTLQDNVDHRASEGVSVFSTEKHSLSLEIGASVIRFVRGKEGSMQKEIEEDLGVKIIIPSSKKEDSIIIEGLSLDSVTRASEWIQSIVDEAVKSPTLDYSHFVSLPLAIHPELVDKLVNFQNSILGIGDACLDESDSNEDTSDNEDKDQQLFERPNVAVEVKVGDDNEHVKVEVKSIDEKHNVAVKNKVGDCEHVKGDVNSIDERPNVAVELKVGDDNEHVKLRMDERPDAAVELKVGDDNEYVKVSVHERPNVAVDLKVGDGNEHVKVDLKSIPLVSYAPKASKSSSRFDLGIDKSIFIKPKTFHLTVLMLKLWNKDRVNVATEVLKSVSSKVMDALDNRPVFVRLKGLDCMRGSLAKARVLYLPVEEIGNDGRLLRACQVIIDAFNEAGLVLEKDAKQKLKLHATVMNARHRKRRSGRKFDSFDARGIFKQFGSEEWGEYLIREAHLSQRFVFDESGYYHCCASIPFPENREVD